MNQAPKENRDTFYKWAYMPLIAPLVVTFALSLLTGRIVISITGVQVSIGATILITVIIYITISVSFYLGMGFFMLSIANLITKAKMPWYFRVMSTMTYPLSLIANKISERHYHRLYRVWDKADERKEDKN